MALAMIGDAGYKIALFFHIMRRGRCSARPSATGSSSRSCRNTRARRSALIAGMRKVDRVLVNPAMILILVAGIIVLATSGSVWKGSQFFVVWGFLAIIALFGLQHGFFAPQMAKLQEVADRDLAAGDTFSDEFQTISQKIAQVGAATGLLIVLTVFIMAYKPFL